MKIFEKLTNEFGDIIDIMHFNKFSKSILISISTRDKNQESALYQACSEQSVEIVELNCSLLDSIGRCDLFGLFFLLFFFVLCLPLLLSLWQKVTSATSVNLVGDCIHV